MTAGRPPLLLVGDERDYYGRSLASVADRGAPVPVLASLPDVWAGLAATAGERVQAGPAGPPPPELGAAGASLADAVERCDLEAVAATWRKLRERLPAPDRPPGAHVVGVGRSAGLAAVRALADGRELTLVERLRDDRVEALGESATSVHVVADSLDYDDALRLQRALDERAAHEVLPGVHACPVGYLHARTFDGMTFLDAKQRLGPLPDAGPQVDVVVDCFLARAPADPLPGLIAVPYADVSRETIAGRARIGLLAMTSHGMADLLHLNGDYLCGRSPFVGREPFRRGRLPSCMEKGGSCYYKPSGRPLEAHRLTAEHVFVNSCGSLRLEEAEFDPLFNLSYSALEGRPRSFVGTLRWKDGRGSEGLLYRHLLRRGHSLGEATLLLNRALLAGQFEATGDVYGLLGDPEERPYPAGPLPAPEPLTAGDNRVRLRDGFGALEARSPELLAAFRDAMLVLQPRARRQLFVTAVPGRSQDRLHVLAFGYEAAGEEAVVRAASAGDLHARVRETYELVEGNLGPALGLNRIYPERVRQGARRNLENRLFNVTRLYRAGFAEPAAVQRFEASCEALWAEVGRIDAEVAGWLADAITRTSFRFSERYQECFLLRPPGEAAACYICGGRTVARSLEHLLRPSLRRTEVLCPRCGGIQDSPDDSLWLEIELGERWRRRSRNPVTVRLTDRSGRARQGYVLLAVRRSAEHAVRPREPVRRVATDAGGPVEVGFEVELGDSVPAHHYLMFAGFVWSTQVFLATRPFWVEAD